MKFQEGPPPFRGETLFEVRIPSDLSLKTPVAIRVASELLTRSLIALEDREAVEVCCEEALKNAIVHGNCENLTQTVIVRLFKENDGWGFSVQDQGKGFSEKKIPDPNDPDYALLEHGRGVHLMGHIMDAVEFYTGGRHVILTKKSQGSHPQASRSPAQQSSGSASAGSAGSTGTAPPASSRIERKDPGAHRSSVSAKVKFSAGEGILLAQIALANPEEAAIDAIFKQIRSNINQRALRLLVLDMSAVRCVSSHLLGELVALSKTCFRTLTKIRLAGVADELDVLITAMKLDGVFPRFKRVEDALSLK